MKATVHESDIQMSDDSQPYDMCAKRGGNLNASALTKVINGLLCQQ